MGSLLLAGAFAFASAAALAQQAPPPSTAPADSVGPKDLQDFSLSGTVTRPSDQPQPAQPAPPKREPRTEAQATPAQVAARPSAPATQRRVETASAVPLAPRNSAPAPVVAPGPAPSVSAPLPNAASSGPSTAPPATAANFAPAPQAPASDHGFGMLPWLLEALALILAGAFLFWRTRGRYMFAGPAHFDLFAAPEAGPAPAPPQPASPPPAAPRQAVLTPAPPGPTGAVSASLRPWVEIGFQPLRCVLEDQRVVVEFEVQLFNSGSAPARAVLVEARLFNPGADQDAQMNAFFANPLGTGDRIALIAPLKRLSVKTFVVAPRDQLLAYELGGRSVFVPLIAFNALYSWSGGEGQTSVSYMIGRDTKSDKLGPFRLDLGPRIFRHLAARLLPTGNRR